MVEVEGDILKANKLNSKIVESHIQDLKVSIFEITNDIYSQFIFETKRNWIKDGYWGKRSEISPGPKNPAIYVSWKDAIYFCNWLSKKDNLKFVYTIKDGKVFRKNKQNGYRLPTEVEWIWIASGGKKSNNFLFSGSNDPFEVGIFDHPKNTSIVGSKKPNELGIYDMSGNAEEWCWDTDTPSENEDSSITELRKSGYIFRIIHGGSYNTSKEYIPNIWSTNASLEESEGNYGFRVVRNN
jgi:formylglycine-generating enzyme